MTTPLAVVATLDERLGRELAQLATDRMQLRITTQWALTLPLIDAEVQLVVIDARGSAAEAARAAAVVLRIRAAYPELPLLFVGALGTAATPEGVEADPHLQQLDSVTSPADLLEQMEQSLETAADDAKPAAPVIEPAAIAVTGTGNQFGEMVFEGITRRFETRSPELKKMLEELMIAASHDVTILLIGETGSGKTYLSNLIHESSPRKHEPFLHVACGALPRELIESELFGHVKGSFTSAHADKDGKFIAARGGTILLDEIDVLGPEQQVKLLKVIETGQFEPVGSNQTLQSRARLVVASNLDLQPLVEQGKFRPDLYYRLNMLKFELPPLRRRKVDLIPMAKKFITHFQQKHNIPIHRIEDSVLETLLAYPWPGNVRELEHVIQRAVIYCRNGVLTKDQLPQHLLSGQFGPTNDPSVRLGQAPQGGGQSLERQVSMSEKEIIEQSLFKHNFSRTRTAKDLGISRVTLYNKMKKYELMK